MATTTNDLVSAPDHSIARLRDVGGQVIGAGFLAGAREIFTCAHVVARALGLAAGADLPRGAEVRLDFPLVAPGAMLTAEIIIWQPPQADNTGDFAGLRLTVPPPEGVQVARLLRASSVWGHSFRTFGFPASHDKGVWASGRLLGYEATGWVQMEDVKSTGYAVEPGFSGAPVWDDELGGVVGMAVATETRPSVRAAYLIPADTLVTSWPGLSTDTLPACPYRGLFAFREQDAQFFFGRGELTAQLTDYLLHKRLVAVVGPSGSGKSSLVLAGAIPQVRQHQGWVVANVRPTMGSSPLGALASALLPLLEPAMSEIRRLAELPQLTSVLADGRLLEVVDRALERTSAQRLLLHIDQFEELYDYPPEITNQFSDLILAAISPPRELGTAAVTVVLTLRADFLGRTLAHAGLAEALQGSILVVGGMTPTQLRRTIEGPAADQVVYEVGLVDRILHDLGAEPGNLPLLEFTLTLLWDSQRHRTLTHASYDELGGVNGALTRYAEQVYLNDLSEPEREAARHVFVQLVRPGEATEPTRRVAHRADMDKAWWLVAQRLARTRLVVTGRDSAGTETAEVVHEALISNWIRLRQWVEADRAFRIWQERIRGAVEGWEGSSRDDGALLRGAPLAEAERWLRERPADITAMEQSYIALSRTFQDRELYTARRKNRRLRGLAVGLGLLTVVAVISGVLAIHLERRATQESLLATSRQLAAQAETRLDSQPVLSILLSVEAFRMKDTAEARSSLLHEVVYHRGVRSFLSGHTGPVTSVAFSPDGRTMASASDDGTVKLWNPDHKTSLKTLTAGGQVHDVAFSGDGHTLASASFGKTKTIILWEAGRYTRLRALAGGDTRSIAFSPDGRTLASASADGAIMLWDFHTGTRLSTVTGVGDVYDVAFSPDGHTLASAGADGTVELWNLDRGIPAKSRTLSGQAGRVMSVAFSPDGHTLASAGADGTVMLWDPRDGARLSPPLTSHTDHVNSVAFSPDGHTFASGGDDKTIIVWDLARLGVLHGHTGTVNSVAFSPDGHTLASGSSDGTVMLWNPDRHIRVGILRRKGATSSGHDVTSVAFGPGGHLLASGAFDGTVTLWNVDRQIQVGTLRNPVAHGPAPWVMSVAFSPKGRMLAAGELDGTITLWDVERQVPLRTLRNPVAGISNIVFSPDGHTLASVGGSGTVVLWDISHRVGARTLPGAAKEGTGIAFSPDGTTLAFADENTILLWDLRHNARLGALTGQTTAVTSVAFSPDGHTLASGSNGDTVMLWDVDHRTPVGALTGHTGPVESVAFSPDGHTLAAAGDDKTVMLWQVSPSQWIQQLCRIAARDLSRAEWDEFLPGQPYRHACG